MESSICSVVTGFLGSNMAVPRVVKLTAALTAGVSFRSFHVGGLGMFAISSRLPLRPGISERAVFFAKVLNSVGPMGPYSWMTQLTIESGPGSA